MRKQLPVLGVVLAAGLAAASAGNVWGLFDPVSGVAMAADAAREPPLMVRTMTVEAAPDTLSRQFFGQIVARETVELAFEVGGTLRRLVPEEGARVAAGETLAQLRLDPFERAVTRAELHLLQARRDAARARQLAARAAGPQARAEDAESVRDLAEVALRDARAALADATLAAPFDALVAVRIAAQHASIARGQPILRLHDMSELRVEVAIPERLFVAAGGLDTIRFAAALGGGAADPLRLVAFQPETNRVGQTYRVTLALPDHARGMFVPGASLTVTATLPAPTRGVQIPAEAIMARNDRSAEVFVLETRDGTLMVRRVPVELTAPTGHGFRVEGLAEGVEIVAAGAHRLRDGQSIRRFTPLAFAEQ